MKNQTRRKKTKTKRTDAVYGDWRRCKICLRMWIACTSCSARRLYCSEECSRDARQRSRRVAVRKYSRSEKGKENQRVRQRKYRLSVKMKTSVTDQRHTPQSIRVRKTKLERQKPLPYRQGNCCLICKRGPLFLPAASQGQMYEDPSPCPKIEKLFQGRLGARLRL